MKVPFLLRPFYRRNYSGQLSMKSWLTNLLAISFVVGTVLVMIGSFHRLNNYEKIYTVQGSQKPDTQLVEDLCGFDVSDETVTEVGNDFWGWWNDETESGTTHRETYRLIVGDVNGDYDYLVVWGARFGPELPEAHNIISSAGLLQLAKQEAGPIRYGEVRHLDEDIREVYCRSDFTWDKTFWD